MILLIGGASHTGKTLTSQRLLEVLKIPYLSIDHLKMGLIRSFETDLTATSSSKDLTDYLWPIVLEMIKTAIENNQSLIVEGCYIPFNYQDDFEQTYLKEITYVCLALSEDYIQTNYDKIVSYESIIERREYESDFDKEELIKENKHNINECIKHHLNYIEVKDSYDIDKIVQSILEMI